MKALSDILPFWHLEETCMVFKDGSLGTGFKLGGYDLTCKVSDDINLLSEKIQNIFLSLDENISCQLFFKMDSIIQNDLKEHIACSFNGDDQIDLIREERVSFMEKRAKNNDFFSPEIYLFLRSLPSEANLKSKNDKEVSKLFIKKRKLFHDKVKEIASLMDSAKLDAIQLNKDECFEIIFTSLNPERIQLGKPRNDQSFPVNTSLCLTDIRELENSIKIGNQYFQVITMKMPPENETYISMIKQLLCLPFHFNISQSFKVLDQKKEKSALELKRRLAFSMASSAKNVSDIESESKLSQIEELLEELIQGSTKLVNFDFNIIIWGNDKEELQEKSQKILKAMRELDRSEAVIEIYTAMDAYIKSLPSVCESFRPLKLKSSNCAHLLPIFKTWSGNKKKVCLLETKDAAPFALDPFSEELPNWNGVVIGSSGAGKSFNVANLMIQFYCQNPRPKLIWIDNGASSKRLIDALGGSFIDFSLESNIKINLFDLPESYTNPGPQKVKLILAVLEMILKEGSAEGLPKKDKALLEEAIYKTYSAIDGTPVLSDLKAILANHNSKELNQYSEILYSWTGDTAYGRILDGKSNISLDKSLVSFEVQHLSDYPDLKDVVLLLLTSFIQDKAQEDLATPYLLLVDEAERLFQTELARQFIITCYRTWRKFKAAIWCMSQNYRDFLANPQIADSLLPNTTSLMILRQRKIDWADFQKAFDFTNEQVEEIKALEIKKGQYSEFFYLQDENQAILRLVPTPLSYWLCTTDASDKEFINTQTKENPNMPLLSVLEKISRGAA